MTKELCKNCGYPYVLKDEGYYACGKCGRPQDPAPKANFLQVGRMIECGHCNPELYGAGLKQAEEVYGGNYHCDCKCHDAAQEEQMCEFCVRMKVPHTEKDCEYHREIREKSKSKSLPPPPDIEAYIKIERLDTITGFQKFPDGEVHDIPRLAAKVNEIIDYLNGKMGR